MRTQAQLSAHVLSPTHVCARTPAPVPQVVGVVDSAEATLPAMDSNGKSDAYVTCKLISPKGFHYPERGYSTSTVYENNHPQWNQSLELTLQARDLPVISQEFYDLP